MGSMRNIEEAIRNKFNVTAGPALHDRVLAQVRHARERSETTLTPREPVVRSLIMRSPIAKLTVAAMLIGVIGLGIFELFGAGGTSGVAWAEVLRKVEQVPVVIFDMTMEFDEHGETLVMPSKNYIAADSRWRSDTFMDGKLMKISYRLPRKNVDYVILVDRKQYRRHDVSYDQAALGREPDDPRTWLKRLLSGDDYTKLGRTTIDGVVVEGVEGRQLESGGETVMRVWVDVKTNLPVRIEMTGMEGGQMMKLVMENFEWDAPLDESLFEPNIPADYTPVEDRPQKQARQEQSSDQPATPQALTEQEKAALPKIKETVRLFLQACSDRNSNEMLKYLPGLEEASAADRAALDTHFGGLEILQIGEPFKVNASGTWRVPCRIKTKVRGTYDKKIDVHYFKSLGRFGVCGGL